MKFLIIPPEVETEIDNSANYYKSQGIELETLFLDEIEHALMKIRKNPEHFPRIKQNIRKYINQNFPFNIFFEVFDEEILILAIGHQKRKPQYWKDRI